MQNKEVLSTLFQRQNISVAKIVLSKQEDYFFTDNKKGATNALLTFSGFMSNEIKKPIVDYYKQEWDLQMGLIPELILRNGNKDVGENGKEILGSYQLYTIEDVRIYIQRLAVK